MKSLFKIAMMVITPSLALGFALLMLEQTPNPSFAQVLFAIGFSALLGVAFFFIMFGTFVADMLEKLLKVLNWTPSKASPPVQARLREVKSAYAELPPESKRKLEDFGVELGRIALSAAAQKFERDAKPNAARATLELRKLL